MLRDERDRKVAKIMALITKLSQDQGTPLGSKETEEMTRVVEVGVRIWGILQE